MLPKAITESLELLGPGNGGLVAIDPTGRDGFEGFVGVQLERLVLAFRKGAPGVSIGGDVEA